MRASNFPLFTLKETPSQAEIVSHRLMLRAGMIRSLGSGLYTWLPLGLRTLQKVTQIVREEMNASGAIELSMPAVQPAKLWQESGRWDDYGPELLRMQDRHDNAFVFGPTHEEVITDLAKRELSSYRQLPINFYQIQTKFRDEIRPRFGIMRAREFLMKDAYSFHIDSASLQDTYAVMFKAYTRIFKRLQLNFRAVHADSGSIGGELSHEFHVLAESGEDAIAFCPDSDYAANVETVPTAKSNTAPAAASEAMQTIDTPNISTIEALSKRLKVPQQQCLKALFLNANDGGVVALFLRGDHTLNIIKAGQHPGIATPVEFASRESIITAVGCPPGSLGPLGLKVPVIVDHAVTTMANFTVGANQENKHITGVNWGRDMQCPEAFDLRNIEAGEPSPDGKGTIEIQRGIEVGHIFQLGDKYSRAMEFTVLDENSDAIVPQMGCYGIGVSRVIAAAIEQNYDENGIIWPPAMAPFSVHLTPLQYHRNEEVRTMAEDLYQQLNELKIDVLLDDRDVRAGIMFSESDLIGIPYRVVMSPRGLEKGEVEIKCRAQSEPHIVSTDDCIAKLCEMIQNHS